MCFLASICIWICVILYCVYVFGGEEVGMFWFLQVQELQRTYTNAVSLAQVCVFFFGFQCYVVAIWF